MEDAPKTRKTRTPWKGDWDHKTSKYIGTGAHEGQERPQDHAPSWWQKSNVISGDRYATAYAEATYHQDLLKTFWFATEAQIKSAHNMVNEWCDDNGFKRIRKLPSRKGRISQKVVARMVASGLFERKN